MIFIIKKLIAYFLCVAISFIPLHTYANTEFKNNGKEAREVGLALAEVFKQNAATKTGNNLTIQDPNSNSNYNLNVAELFPGTSSSASNSGYFPDDNVPDNNSIGGIFDDSEGMGQIGNDSKEALWTDANSSNPSLTGAAYKVLTDASSRSRPDFRNDPLMNLSKDTYSNIDIIAEGFGDCSVDTSYTDLTRSAHIPDYKRCQRVIDKSTTCEILHEYDASVVKHYNGPYNLKSCGTGCTELWIGKVGDNYWSGNCSIYEESTSIIVSNPDAILSASLEYVKWDDYIQVWIGKAGQINKVWQGPDNNFPPETTTGECELNQSWEGSPNIDVTPYFKNVAPGDVVTFKIRVSVSGDGEGYGRIKLRYDTSKVVTKDKWSPEECIDSAKGVEDGFADGELICLDNPADESGCTLINSIRVCESHLSPSPLPSISNLCKKVKVTSDYQKFYSGELDCFTDINGNQQCLTAGIGQLDSCEVLDENPQCGFISSQCVSGAKGESGTCYLHEDIYDCGSSVDIPSHGKSQKFNCGGEIKCMGDECLDIYSSQSQDFAKAAALLNAAQFMTQDMTCTGIDDNGNATGNENVKCEAFGGKPGECKKVTAGLQNCCDTPVNVTMADYLLMLKAGNKLGTAIWQLDNPYVNAARGAYQSLGDSAAQSWSEVTKPFASYIENISGAVDSFTSTVSEFKDQIVDMLKEQLEKVMNDILTRLGYEGGGAAAQGAAASATEQIMNSGPAQFLGQVMTVYGYVALAIAVIKLVFKCEEEEFELNTKRELKSCHYVGSYCNTKVLGVCTETREVHCCYNSPLSRIIQEQIRPQLNMGWGTTDSPSCGGIPMDRLHEVNWDLVNLDEWLGILKTSGQLDNQLGLNMQSLTGTGNPLNINNSRLDATDRTKKRLEGVDVDEIRKNTAESLASGVDHGQNGGGG